MGSTWFPRSSLPADASLASTGSSRASSPASTVLSKRYDFLPPIPPRFVTAAWWYLACTRSFRSSTDECAAEAWSSSPGISSREGCRGNDRISQVPGEPQCPFAHVQSTPAGLLAPDHCGVAAWPLVCEQQRLLRKVFRRSIAWLSDWLSTLRRAGYPAATQDSLPAAGQALPDGLSPAGSLRKVSKLLPYIFSSFPKLTWRNHIDRRVVPADPRPRGETCRHVALSAGYSGERLRKRAEHPGRRRDQP